MPKTILITGGAGAIGANLTPALLERGFRVVVLDDLSSGFRENVPHEAVLLNGCVTDDAILQKAFSYQPDLVLHLAALFANQNSVAHPERDLLANGMGTLKVVKKAAETGVSKLVYFSSSCVYGASPEMGESSLDLRPETPYAITKLLGEQYCQYWTTRSSLSIAVLRIFNTFGPGEFPGKYRNVVPNFFERAMNHQPLPVFGTGEETRCFTFVEDTVQGVLTALFSDTGKYNTFNIGTSVETRIIDLANRINTMTGNPAGVEYLPRRDWDHVVRRKSDVEKARKFLGFEAKVSLEEGLLQTYEWLKKYAKTDSSHLVRISPISSSRSISGRENTGLPPSA